MEFFTDILWMLYDFSYMFQFITEVHNFRFYSSLRFRKKRERLDESEEEVEHSNDRKEKLEK